MKDASRRAAPFIQFILFTCLSWPDWMSPGVSGRREHAPGWVAEYPSRAGAVSPARASRRRVSRVSIENMYESRPEAAAGRIVVAQLMGAVGRLAGWKPELTGEELESAVRELQAIAEGRPDGPALMAEAAGLLTGFRFPVPAAPGAPIRESQLLEARKSVVEAQILVAAGADERLIDGWACIGAERAAEARQPPFGARLLGAGQRVAGPARPASDVPARVPPPAPLPGRPGVRPRLAR